MHFYLIISSVCFILTLKLITNYKQYWKSHCNNTVNCNDCNFKRSECIEKAVFSLNSTLITLILLNAFICNFDRSNKTKWILFVANKIIVEPRRIRSESSQRPLLDYIERFKIVPVLYGYMDMDYLGPLYMVRSTQM